MVNSLAFAATDVALALPSKAVPATQVVVAFLPDPEVPDSPTQVSSAASDTRSREHRREPVRRMGRRMALRDFGLCVVMGVASRVWALKLKHLIVKDLRAQELVGLGRSRVITSADALPHAYMTEVMNMQAARAGVEKCGQTLWSLAETR